jgi:hypothetical protein
MTRATHAKTNRIRLGKRGEAHAHKQVAEVAKKMAHEVFDQIMTKRGDIFDRLKKQNPEMSTKELEEFFVAKLFPTLLVEARATLAGMLRDPSNSHLHPDIYEALLLDNTLLRGRGRLTAEEMKKGRLN